MSAEGWYVAKGSAGFTNDPEQAEKNSAGHPYACNGHVARVWKAHYSQDKIRRNMVWDLLVNAMENQLEAQEKDPADTSYDREVAGLKTALSVMHYGFVSGASIQAITKEANRRYDED